MGMTNMSSVFYLHHYYWRREGGRQAGWQAGRRQNILLNNLRICFNLLCVLRWLGEGGGASVCF